MVDVNKDNSRANLIVNIIWAVILLVVINVYFFNNVLDSTGNNSHDEDKKDITFYVSSLPYGVDPLYYDSVKEATSYWGERDKNIFKEAFSEDDADVRIQWVKEFGGEHIGYTLGNSFIEIGLGDSMCSGKWQAYNYESILNIIKHEIGHVLGYNHSIDTKNIMYKEILTKYETDIDEQKLLPAGYIMAYPLCSRNNNSRYLISINSDGDIDVYIVPSNKDYEKLAEDEEFSYNRVCSARGKISYKKTCNISRDSLIVLHNPYYNDASFRIVAKEL